jgi:cardiolipin synthase
VLTLPNILTLGRLVLVPCFLWASMRGMYTAAFTIFVTAAVTDILDGAIARHMNLRSKIGALLDPAADKILMVCAFLYYTFAKMPVVSVPGWLTFTIFMRDVMIVFFVYLLYTRIQIRRFPPSVWGKISTGFQATTMSIAIAVNAFLPSWQPFVELAFRLTLLVTLISGWTYLRRAAQLVRDEAPAHA